MTSIADYPRSKCASLVELLRTRAFDEADKQAYTFLGDGEVETDHLTYAELDLRARALAARLQECGAQGARVMLLHPSGLDFIVAFFGCLYAGAVAVPAYPPRHNRNNLRLSSIIADAQPAIALTTAPILARMENAIDETADLKSLRWMASDIIDVNLAAQWREPPLSGDALAFLQYTSGSTSTPKGVMVSHENILHTTSSIRSDFEHHLKTVLVTWLPTFHDLGLIEGVLQPMITGFPSIMMPPNAFLQRPSRWLQAISRYRATYSAAPNFAYDLCVRKTTPEQREALDLSSWEVAVNAAEPVHKTTMERFSETFAPHGFRWRAFCPSYGLAEATLKVSTSRRTQEPLFYTVEANLLEHNHHEDLALGGEATTAPTQDKHSTRTLVGCGRAQSASFHSSVTIAHPQTGVQCPPDHIGEIWVSGPSVAQGYWNKPEETARTFQAHLTDTGEGPFLRTGDLGFMKDGELYITGRLKDLVIIEGRNHYPQDIEKTVESVHPAFRQGCSAAFSTIHDGEERLVVVVEVNRGYRPGAGLAGETPEHSLDPKQLLKMIRRAVAEEHDVQVYDVVLLRMGTILKTSSGKIQRSACRAGYLNQTLELWAGRGESIPVTN
jgi:acyl-CoA synthetase (AMP-forming)/AMP-acid ligase II